MTSSPQNSAGIRQPRTRPAPSPRDQQIYLDYQTTGQRQIDLATQYKLTQTRISQIIRRVEKWLTSTLDLGTDPVGWAVPTAAPDDPAARERLQHRVQYDRLNEAGRLAMQHFREPQKIVTRKKGARAGKKFHETTERLLPPNLQCLKIIVQSSTQLTRLHSSRHTPCADGRPCAVGSPKPVGWASPTTAPDQLALSREQVEAWIVEHQRQSVRAGKGPDHWNIKDIVHDLLNTLSGEPTKNLALHALAHDAGKKVVDRKPYEDQPPRVPPIDGWYYAMYDADGALVAWIHADQLADAISPDYPPVSRSTPLPPGEGGDGHRAEGVVGSPGDGLQLGELQPMNHSPAASSNSFSTTSSSTSPSTTNSPQPTGSPALTSVSTQTQFPAPYELQPFDLQTIQPDLYQKGCSN